MSSASSSIIPYEIKEQLQCRFSKKMHNWLGITWLQHEHTCELTTALFAVAVVAFIYINHQNSQKKQKHGTGEFSWFEYMVYKSCLGVYRILHWCTGVRSFANSLKQSKSNERKRPSILRHRSFTRPLSILRSRNKPRESENHKSNGLRFKTTLFESHEDRRDPSETPRYSQPGDTQMFNDVIQTIYRSLDSPPPVTPQHPSEIDLKTYIGEVITPEKTKTLQTLTSHVSGSFHRIRTEDYASIFQSYSSHAQEIEVFDQYVSSASLALLLATRSFETQEEANEFIEFVLPLVNRFRECVNAMQVIVEDLRRGTQGLLDTITELVHLFGSDFRDFRDVELALRFCEIYLSLPNTDKRLVEACEIFDPVNTPHTISAFSSYRNVECGLTQILSELRNLPCFFTSSLRECEAINEVLTGNAISNSIQKGESCARLLVTMQTCTDLIDSLEFYASGVEKYYLIVYEYLLRNCEHIRIAEQHDVNQLSSSIGSFLLTWNDNYPHIDVVGTARVFKPSFG